VHILGAVLLTGMITFFISVCGVKIGNLFGTKFKSKAELAGGVVLILIGIKILIEHLYG
jgi:putative Mn2+ efflux pump MntP